MQNLDKEVNEQVKYIFNQLEPYLVEYEADIEQRDKDVIIMEHILLKVLTEAVIRILAQIAWKTEC